jgi:hypothetical protein
MNQQKLKLLRARVALSFYALHGRRPTDHELDRLSKTRSPAASLSLRPPA